MAVSEDKLNAFLGKAVRDLGACISAVLMLTGSLWCATQGCGELSYR